MKAGSIESEGEATYSEDYDDDDFEDAASKAATGEILVNILIHGR